MSELEASLRRLKHAASAAMRLRRAALPGSDAYRRADELVHELAELTAQLRSALERRQGRTGLVPTRSC